MNALKDSNEVNCYAIFIVISLFVLALYFWLKYEQPPRWHMRIEELRIAFYLFCYCQALSVISYHLLSFNFAIPIAHAFVLPFQTSPSTASAAASRPPGAPLQPPVSAAPGPSSTVAAATGFLHPPPPPPLVPTAPGGAAGSMGPASAAAAAAAAAGQPPFLAANPLLKDSHVPKLGGPPGAPLLYPGMPALPPPPGAVAGAPFGATAAAAAATPSPTAPRVRNVREIILQVKTSRSL